MKFLHVNEKQELKVVTCAATVENRNTLIISPLIVFPPSDGDLKSTLLVDLVKKTLRVP